MKRSLVPCLVIALVVYGLQAKAQTWALNADTVKRQLQGAWKMREDTNVVLIFTGDSMVHRMMRTSGMGRVKFTVTSRNCDTTRNIKEKALYLQETYRYYQYKTPMEGKLCNKIIYLQNNVLMLKRDGIFETYTKLKGIPPPHK